MKLNVAVVFGGKSVEHEISILSALQAIAAIDQERYQVIPIYITKEGQWYTGTALLELENYKNLETLIRSSHRVTLNQNRDKHELYYVQTGLLSRTKTIKLDLVFPVLHGTHGEDGTIQGIFTSMNIPYVGCSTLASAITMDKVTTKLLLQSLGVKVLDYFWLYSERWLDHRSELVSAIEKKLRYPVIVKPGDLGSSIGVSMANNTRELEDAIDLASRMSNRVLIEPKIVNLKEINCSVLGDRDLAETSVCEEPIKTENILSYVDKYAGGTKTKLGNKLSPPQNAKGGMSSSKRKIPAEISPELSDKIRAIAKQVFVDLDCNGVVRIDFLLDQDTNEIYLCELNTIPGSLSFYLWQPSGKNFQELIERLFALALKRQRENDNLITSYTANILGF